MNDIVILKASYHMNQRGNFANMTQKFVSEPFAFGGALYKTCDIAELNGGVDCLL